MQKDRAFLLTASCACISPLLQQDTDAAARLEINWRSPLTSGRLFAMRDIFQSERMTGLWWEGESSLEGSLIPLHAFTSPQ